MMMSDWAILIGAPMIFGTVALCFILNGKPGSDILIAGAVLTLPCWFVNDALPPVGACLLGGLIAFAVIFTAISAWRERRGRTNRSN